MQDKGKKNLSGHWDIILENTLEMILIFGADGCIIEGNQVAKTELGYGEQLIGISICKVFQRVLEMKDGQVVCLNQDGQQKKIETVAYRKNQTCFDVDLKVTIQKGEDGYFGMCAAQNTAVRVGAIKDMIKAKEDRKSVV